jgi:hypothetical protein
MKILDLLSKAGNLPLISALPGVGTAKAIVDAVNIMLPSDKQIDENSTGDEVEEAIKELPAEQRAILLGKQIDLKITESNNWLSVQQALNSADASGASTRPEIAKLMAYVVVFTIASSVTALLAAVLLNRAEIVLALSNAWPLILAMIATPIVLLRSYFGLRTNEKQSRYTASAGFNPIQEKGFLGKLLS